MQDKNKKIAEQLKELNRIKGPVSKELLEYNKNYSLNQKKVLDAIKQEKTIPEISKETGIPSNEVLKYITGLVKYGKAEIIQAKTGYLKYKAK